VSLTAWDRRQSAPKLPSSYIVVGVESTTRAKIKAREGRARAVCGLALSRARGVVLRAPTMVNTEEGPEPLILSPRVPHAVSLHDLN